MSFGELAFYGFTFGFSVGLGIIVAAGLWSIISRPPESLPEVFLRMRAGWVVLAEAFENVGRFVIGAARR